MIQRHIRPRSFPLQRPRREYRVDGATYSNYSIYLNGDGTVYGFGNNAYGQLSNLNSLQDIVGIAITDSTAFFLNFDGTVVGSGAYATATNDWQDIVQISAGHDSIVGLKSDGTCVCAKCAGNAINVSSLKDIVQISCCGGALMALNSSGTISFLSNGNIGSWIHSGGDGTVWTGIKAVEVQSSVYLSSALLPDGSVITRGWGDAGYTLATGRKDVVSHRLSARIGVALLEDGSLMYKWRNGKNEIVSGANASSLCTLQKDEASGYSNIHYAAIDGYGKIVHTANIYSDDTLQLAPPEQHYLNIRKTGNIVSIPLRRYKGEGHALNFRIGKRVWYVPLAQSAKTFPVSVKIKGTVYHASNEWGMGGGQVDTHTLALLHLDNTLNDDSVKKVKFVRDYGNAVFSTNSKFGTHALQFDGKSSIACPYGSGGITLGKQFTIDFWGRETGNFGHNCFFMIGPVGNVNTVSFYEYGTNAWMLGTYPRPLKSYALATNDQKWHHYAFVYDNGIYTVYFDGKSQGSFAYSFNPQNGYKIRFGGSIGAGNEFWLVGSMDEIRISDCVRYTSNFLLER